MEILRDFEKSYPLANIEKGGASVGYVLMVFKDRSPEVQRTIINDNFWRKDSIKRIPQWDFPNHKVDGVSLAELVNSKLEEIKSTPN